MKSMGAVLVMFGLIWCAAISMWMVESCLTPSHAQVVNPGALIMKRDAKKLQPKPSPSPLASPRR